LKIEKENKMALQIDWPEIEKAIEKSHRVLLYGPPGCGKTHTAILLQNESLSVTLNEESTVAEILGHWIPKGQEFTWHNGAGTKAWIEGRGLVLNEIDQASGAVLTTLHALLDDFSMAQIYLPTGNTIKPKEGFSVIATMNGEIDALPEALQDRFELKIHVSKPHPAALAKLPEWQQNHFTQAGNLWNFTLREFLAFNKMCKQGIPVEIAAKTTVQERWQELIDLLKLT